MEEKTDQEHLEGALENRQPRYFRAGAGKCRGRTGRADIEAFAENLGLLQQCSVRIGDQLRMDTVSHCIVYEKDSTVGYRYDSDSNPRNPFVVGAMVNRQIEARDLLMQLANL